jgi:hypothetical protein
MSTGNIITKNNLRTITSIKIDTDNFSWSILDYDVIHPIGTNHPTKLQLTLVKTSKLKKIFADKPILTEEIDPELIKKVIFNLQSTEPQDQIFLNSNVVNLCNSFTKIINVLKTED